MTQADDRNLMKRAEIHYVTCIDAYNAHEIRRLIKQAFAMDQDAVKVQTTTPADVINSFQALGVSTQSYGDLCIDIFEVLKIYLPLERNMLNEFF